MSVLFSRRTFLSSTGALAGAVAWGRNVWADDAAPMSRPRATDGDDRAEPDWEQKVVVSVGPQKADFIGRDDKVLQAAILYVQQLGGGTVKLLPGTFTLRSAVHMRSGVRLVGSGPDTVITKTASETIPLADDSDWYDQEITLKKAGGFRVGDEVTLQSKNADTGARTVIKRRIIAKQGARFKLHDGLRENLWLTGDPTCSSLFPLLTSERTADVVIENLTLDGNKANNANLNGNYAGCIFLQDCNRYTIRGVEARNYNGDGISFQICHDVVVQDCHSHDHAGLGLHPGSGSQRPQILNNRLERCDQGLFWCWGVKFGLAEGNKIDGNRRYGVSIGHNDTDNVMRNNVITNSGQVGILFRNDQRGRDFWANRNRIEKNRIENSGGAAGVAIDVQGKTKDVVIIDNDLRETRQPMQRIGVRLAADAGPVQLSDNRFQGFNTNVAQEANS